MPPYEGDYLIGQELYSMPLADLKHGVIGVEATSYLQRMINELAHEPLVVALGGIPFGLKKQIEVELDRWKDYNITPLFVFDGQSIVGKNEITMRDSKLALSKTQKAWDIYAEGQPAQAVTAFGAAGAIRAQDLAGILLEVLDERSMDFIIAPFNANAQLAYLIQLETPYIDGIMGSQELLLYDIDDAIIFPPSETNWKEEAFSGIVKSEVIKKLNVTPDMFSDALLMTGTSFLPTFPPLQDDAIITRQPYNVGDAINLLRTSEKSVASTCSTFADILQLRDRNWLDKYRKAKMSIKHSVTIQENGQINVREYENLTSDNIAYLGLQLPAELYHYLSKALIGPRLLNAFGSLSMHVFPTEDGIHSEEYRRLLTQSLVPLKETAAALVSSRIHRGFQFREITMRFWFDENLTVNLNPRTLQSQTNDKADTWRVKEPILKTKETKSLKSGRLSFALLSLQDKELSKQTISKPKSGVSTPKLDGPKLEPILLDSKPEVLSNVLWRLLHIRGYINDQHELTTWGNALATTLKALQPIIEKYNDVHRTEEAALLAFELLRFDNLSSRNPHNQLVGGPLRGSEEDKACCRLIGRTACLLKLRHQEIGYTGPLSRNFLVYYSIIKAVRQTDRDLLEAITASMFLNNQVNRNRKDFADLGRSLPLGLDVDLAMGIGIKTYLDDHVKLEASREQRETDKTKFKNDYLPYSVNFNEDLDVAFDFFEAVYAGVKVLGNEISEADRKVWEDAKVYLAKRR